jgi:Helix-turn-helix domain
MSARRTAADQTGLDSAWGPEAARLLALLRRERDGVTVTTMREHAIEAPAQAIYTLQLAGYAIDRTRAGPNGLGGPVYRLRVGGRHRNGQRAEAVSSDES